MQGGCKLVALELRRRALRGRYTLVALGLHRKVLLEQVDCKLVALGLHKKILLEQGDCKLVPLLGHCMARVGDCKLVLEQEHCRSEHCTRAQMERCRMARKEREHCKKEHCTRALLGHCKMAQQEGCMRAQVLVLVRCTIVVCMFLLAARRKMGLGWPEFRTKNQSCLKKSKLLFSFFCLAFCMALNVTYRISKSDHIRRNRVPFLLILKNFNTNLVSFRIQLSKF